MFNVSTKNTTTISALIINNICIVYRVFTISESTLDLMVFFGVLSGKFDRQN